DPVFEMVVLGSGGGPLETDCSGYLLKPASSRWEDGILALEGGSGIGALTNLLKTHPVEELFPNVNFPETHNSPILKAAYIFSFLTCYLITHAHLDHAVSLILLSGSVPCKQRRTSRQMFNEHSNASEATADETVPPVPARIPVYATQETLDNLAAAYGGGLWPELGAWATPEELMQSGRRKRRRTQDELNGVGPKFYPKHTHLNAHLPISTLVFPVAHGHTSQGPYSSSATFIRHDPSLMASRPVSRRASQSAISTPQEDMDTETNGLFGTAGREFLFFGDVESEWRADHEAEVDRDGAAAAGAYNRAIWEQAAMSFGEGRLAGIFLECSYDSTRPATIMFGHLSPPGIMHELRTLASFVGKESSRPLEGLKIFITHVKEFLVPHRSGVSARELIKIELDALEAENQLGVTFNVISPGDRL
ncbi:hypothetical protein CC85DRAFT_231499, partial [Cutaneotrichosporon oleaginosum]